MPHQLARRIYSAEELHRLRGSCSAPRLSEAIEEHVAEDAELVKGMPLQRHDHTYARTAKKEMDPAQHINTWTTLPNSLNFLPQAFDNTYLRSPSTTMQDSDFARHRMWVEDVFTTPTPINRGKYQSMAPLTMHASPTDHILRGSRSFAARSFRSRNGLNGLRSSSDRTNNENVSMTGSETQHHPPAVTDRSALAEIAPNNQAYRPTAGRFRPSPTPSIKRKKVEDLVRAHGSPQHIRVTTGGRIVPSEQSPLCFPRFGYSAIKANGGLIKFAPNSSQGKPDQWVRPSPDGAQQGYLAEDHEGKLCQIVDGMVLPLAQFNGAFHLYIPAPNLSVGGSMLGDGPALSESTMLEHQRIADAVPPVFVPLFDTQAQMATLEADYATFEHDLKELDKSEVLQGRNMSREQKSMLVARRRQLVIGMDRIRKTIKSLKEQRAPATERPVLQERPQTPHHGARSEHASLSPASTVQYAQQQQTVHPAPPGPYYGMPPYMPMPGAMPGHETGFAPGPYMVAPMGFYMQPPPFDGMSGFLPPYQPYQGGHPNAVEPLPTAQRDGASDLAKIETRPGSPRHSRALPVRDPETKQIYNVKSLLNPMSPAYKPAVDGHNGSERSSNMDNALKHRSPTPLSVTRLADSKYTAGHGDVSSSSSFRTLDFFPQNARDHSLRKHEYPPSTEGSIKENAGPRNSDRGSSEMSSTHHNADWNPEIPARTFSKAVTSPKAPPGTPAKTVTAKNHHYESFPGKIDATGFIDFSQKPRAWIEGYQAGLQRRPIAADCTGFFLDGYCSGLLKSQPRSDIELDMQRTIDSDQTMRRMAIAPDSQQPTTMLKHNVVEPANEVAVSSSAPNDPTVADTAFNLGTWHKQHDHLVANGQGLAGFPFPDRKSSIEQSKSTIEQRRNVANPDTSEPEINNTFRRDFSFTASHAKADDNAGIASNVHSRRVVTPLEWRTRNSLANIANMTTTLFTQGQVDGHTFDRHSDDRQPMLSNASEIAGSSPRSRFKEASIDGGSPLASPTLSANISPPVSPRTSAMKRFRERHSSPKVSPLQQSPGKTQTAIRVTQTSPQKQDTGNGPSPSKRGWKDLWRNRATPGRSDTP